MSALVAVALGCKSQPPPTPDHPRLTPGVRMQDVSFHSAALGRSMPYRAVMPMTLGTGQRLPVIYFLHGGGGGFRDWTNYSDVARYAQRGFLLIMPEGESSYYMNSATRSQDRFEDSIVHDLISDVEQRFPALAGGQNRAIIGISMGGFGAVVLGLKHPELFAFVGGLSSALDVPSRPFSIKRMEQWRHHSSIFGSRGSEKRKANDPYVLARQAHPAAMPYIFLFPVASRKDCLQLTASLRRS